MNISWSTNLSLAALSQMPFLDSVELAAVTALPERTAREALRRLHEHGCARMVLHTRPDASRVRRWYLTPAGIEELSKSRFGGESIRELVVANDLLSAQGRRYLVRRLDVVAVLYKVAQDLALDLKNREGLPFTWRWERRGALDAVLQLPDGRTIAISRIGSTHVSDALGNRLRTLRNMHKRSELRATLLLVPGEVELGRALTFMKEHLVYEVFVTIEAAFLHSTLHSVTWTSPERKLFSLSEVLANAPSSDLPGTRRPEERRTMPSADISGDANELDLVASDLSTPSRALLRLLYDWPFIRVSQMQRMTGFSEGHLGRVKGQLSQAGLLHHLRIGRTPKQRHANETRLSLSESGLLYLTRKDRSSDDLARKHWLVKPCVEGDEQYRIPHFQVTGTMGGTLLREIRHTDGVYAFISLLMSSCKASIVWDLVQALPAHRWERHYKYGTRRNRRFRHITARNQAGRDIHLAAS